MVKKIELPYLVRITNKKSGKTYVYFRRNGETTALPPEDDEGFMAAYQAAKSGKAKRPPARNFRKLIESYLASERYTKLAPRTKSDYRKQTDYIMRNISDKDPSKMKRADVVIMMEANLHRKKFANDLKQVLSILFEHGIDKGWLTSNAARGVKKYKTGEGHSPWPDHYLKAFRKAADPKARLLMEMCIGTGQRIGDVLEMKWTDIQDGGINVKQNKTGAELWIPFTDRLSAYLDGVKKEGFYIITNPQGQKLSHEAAAYRVRRVKDKKGVKIPAKYKIHGWRYNAAQELAEAGCSDAQIAAITGHKSLEMVAQYSRKGAQKTLAAQAQKKRG